MSIDHLVTALVGIWAGLSVIGWVFGVLAWFVVFTVVALILALSGIFNLADHEHDWRPLLWWLFGPEPELPARDAARDPNATSITLKEKSER